MGLSDSAKKTFERVLRKEIPDAEFGEGNIIIRSYQMEDLLRVIEIAYDQGVEVGKKSIKEGYRKKLQVAINKILNN